jgi:hypothetical protein
VHEVARTGCLLCKSTITAAAHVTNFCPFTWKFAQPEMSKCSVARQQCFGAATCLHWQQLVTHTHTTEDPYNYKNQIILVIDTVHVLVRSWLLWNFFTFIKIRISFKQKPTLLTVISASSVIQSILTYFRQNLIVLNCAEAHLMFCVTKLTSLLLYCQWHTPLAVSYFMLIAHTKLMLI